MKRRYWMLTVAVLSLALLLAFPLRPLLERAVILPAAYILWLMRLFYDAMPQAIWWAAELVLVLFIALGALIPGERFASHKAPETRPAQGQVEGLAYWIKKTQGGIYYKWLVAHRLGKLAHQMLVQREGSRPRSVFSPLIGADWQPGAAMQEYLETGLHGSFADFPGSASRIKPLRHTPLDLDIGEVVEFLESKTETNRDRHF